MDEPPQDMPQKVASFQDVTGLSDPAQCAQILEAHNWDVNAAVGTVLGLTERDGSEAGPSNRGRGEPSGAGPSTSRLWEEEDLDDARWQDGGTQNQAPGLFRQVFLLPGAIIGGGVSLALGAARLGLWATSGVLGYGLHSLSSAANWALGMPSQPRLALTGLSEAARFVRDFEAEYGSRHPAFVDAPFMGAVRLAQQQFKFLFVYLHSPEHANTPDFCHNTLCSDAVIQYVNEHFVCWGGSIHQSEGFQMSSSLKASTYPFVAIVTATPGSVQRAALLQQIEGPRSAEELISQLQRALDEQGAVLAAARAEEEERRIERQLREEQDAAYQAALRADQERERKAAEEAAKAAAEAAALAEQQRLLEEAKVKAEKEAAERVSMLERRRSEKAAALGPEPAKGPGVTQVSVRLPSGERKERRFRSSDVVQTVYDFVDSLESLSHVHYSLVMSFPRKVFGPETRSLTLVEAGLHPHASLLVQEEDG